MTSASLTGKPVPSDPIGFEKHDHRTCISVGLAAAEAHCLAEGLRFTQVRRKALEILLQEHRALGAYEMLSRLSDAGFGSQPPVAYRALEFLVAEGFVHKIERLNAFIACAHPGANHAPAFMICRSSIPRRNLLLYVIFLFERETRTSFLGESNGKLDPPTVSLIIHYSIYI